MNNANTIAATPVRRVNMDNIEESWWPADERMERDDGGNGKLKVRSLNGNTRALRGGDWISSRHAMMTLAVAWTEHGKKYGLTVAHVFTYYGLAVGDSVFAFDSDDVVVGRSLHKSIKIGTVVSIDTSTDSAVFEIFPSIAIDPLAVALSGGDDHVCRITLPIPKTTDTASLDYGQKLVMYGADRRGMIGTKVQASGREKDNSALFATRSFVATTEGDDTNGETKLSFGGDCGALYLDVNGTPWCMHTMIQGVPLENPKVWTSRGALLRQIVDSHAFFFGYIPLSSGRSSSYESQSSPGHNDATVRIAVDHIFNLKTGGQAPRLFFPDEELKEPSFFAKQPLLVSSGRIRMHFPDEDNTTNVPGNEEEEEEKKQKD